jgi:hypothetical protein
MTNLKGELKMYNYNIYLKLRIEEFDTTAGMNFNVKENNLLNAAKLAKEMNKDKSILYSEVANLEKSEPITFFDGITLEIFRELN